MSKHKVTKHVRENIENGGLSNVVVLAIIEGKWHLAWKWIQNPEEARRDRETLAEAEREAK